MVPALSPPCFLAALCLVAPARAEDIKPPFGLIWGESSERLERLLKNAKATIVEKRKAETGAMRGMSRGFRRRV